MYLKIISSILILGCFWLIGAYFAYKPIYRKNDLLEVKKALLTLSSEISFLSNINEAIISIEKKINNPIKNIFKKFRIYINEKRGEELSILWNQALKECCDKTFLTDEDINNLKNIGKIIGAFDINFNREGINMVVDYIDQEIKNIEVEKSKNFRTYQSLGVLSGLLIIILLV